MKVAVLSDIHGNGIALNCAIRDLKNIGINKVIILGDVVMKGPMPLQVLELLNDKALEILAWIKGNTEMKSLI
jgi:predicted phosphodiesterase